MICELDVSEENSVGQVRCLANQDDPWPSENRPLRLQIEATAKEGGEVKISDPIVITFINPCINTEIQRQVLMPMITNKNQPAVHQDFRIFKDSVSIAKGDGSGYDLCLPQTYKLAQLGSETVPSFVSLDAENRRITVMTDQNTETGNYAMYLVVILEEYGV